MTDPLDKLLSSALDLANRAREQGLTDPQAIAEYVLAEQIKLGLWTEGATNHLLKLTVQRYIAEERT